MGSTSIDEDLVEEREELMVSYSENNSQPMIKKAHFLKPCVTSIEGMLRPASCPELKASSLCVSFRGWRLPNKKFQFWAKKMAALHKPTWLKSGIFEAIKASTYKIHKNQSLILSLAQNWCPETNTFVFPWGEATITLEDVNVLLGFSVLGSSVLAPLESSEMREAVEKLEEREEESMSQDSWISSFVDDEMEHEAFLVLWLSKFVFPDKLGRSVVSDVFPIAVRLARGERVALAPAVLANLYHDLSQICALASTKNVYPNSLFKLVQVWVWERFKIIRPEAKVIPWGKPRIARWSGLKQIFGDEGLILFDGNFEWRPYTEPLENWNPPRFYLEDAKWVRIGESLDGDDDEFVSFARCVRVSKLVGIGLVENYYPNRVAMQFGLAQDLPVLATHHRRNSTKQEAWDDYNKSLDGLRLYIPSRLATASVTARYRDWWTKSVSEMRKESTETFNVGSTVDHYDDSDVDILLKVLPLSQILQKQKAKQSPNKRRKRACEDDESADTEDDDNMTIDQRVKSRKKCSDHVENTEGERSRLEVDNNNVSGLPQKLAYGDETVATQATEQKNDEKNSSNPSDEDVVTDAERLKQRKLATIAQRINYRKQWANMENTEGKRSRLGVDKNVSGLPQKLNDETVATKETEQKTESVIKTPSKPSNGAATEKQEDDEERLKQRKLAIEELELKMEARILKVENTLAKIKQWKLTRTHTKTPVSA
ncbi:PREDICTED: uncharacterized protein LOC104723535 [Camelina sativa]|uniref:Uncharacterized protein LOC104723535 n=1 Tax=Camelina sativa TaxID=90675 RepID=A0ABM0UF23_CAMSA|nr:PREDICTED: uncharacterized protein LOC104723535 [Camelina sativa]